VTRRTGFDFTLLLHELNALGFYAVKLTILQCNGCNVSTYVARKFYMSIVFEVEFASEYLNFSDASEIFIKTCVYVAIRIDFCLLRVLNGKACNSWLNNDLLKSDLIPFD